MTDSEANDALDYWVPAQPQPEAQDEYPSVKQKRLLGEARAVLAASRGKT